MVTWNPDTDINIVSDELRQHAHEVTQFGIIVRHFKRTKEAIAKDPAAYMYRVLGVALNTATSEHMVMYEAVYGDRASYVRPLYEFLSEVDHDKYPYISQKYRFEPWQPEN